MSRFGEGKERKRIEGTVNRRTEWSTQSTSGTFGVVVHSNPHLARVAILVQLATETLIERFGVTIVDVAHGDHVGKLCSVTSDLTASVVSPTRSADANRREPQFWYEILGKCEGFSQTTDGFSVLVPRSQRTA